MATPTSITAKPKRSPVQQAARTANVWGWSFIITILGAFGAGYVQAGPLRVLLLNLGILCFIIGVLELVWRHQLLKTGDAKWAKVLMWNQVAGTLSLLWSLYLLYVVPDSMLVDYAKHSDLWNQVMPLIKQMDNMHVIDDKYIEHIWHLTKLLGVYGIGSILMLSQLWVIWHYRKLARLIAQAPAAPVVPPILK